MAAEIIIEKGILLTFDEVRILLYALGKNRVEGVVMPEKEFQEADVLNAMHRLSQAGFITAGDDRFTVREDIRRILEIVSEPEETEIWKPHGSEGPAYFLSRADRNVVISERFWRRKNTIRYALFSEEQFRKFKEESDDYS